MNSGHVVATSEMEFKRSYNALRAVRFPTSGGIVEEKALCSRYLFVKETV